MGGGLAEDGVSVGHPNLYALACIRRVQSSPIAGDFVACAQNVHLDGLSCGDGGDIFEHMQEQWPPFGQRCAQRFALK